MEKIEEKLSIINSNLEIEGGLIGLDSNLLIRGTIKGPIKAKEITIAKEGRVFSDIEADIIVINGSFNGNIKADKLLKILSEGSCSGKVVCRDLSIEEGGILNAEISTRKKEIQVLEQELEKPELPTIDN